MMLSRRHLLRRSATGLAAIGAGTLTLRADAAPTESSGDLGAYGDYQKQKPGKTAPAAAKRDFAPTEDNILGPFYRERAPYRAKVTPPLAAGTVLLVGGRVWGADTRAPLAGATIDVWQANTHGRYDNDDPKRPPASDVFLNRVRLMTGENGAYELETIHPGRYQIAPGVWRPSHIHYLVRAPGYKTLVTQLYFNGDPMNAKDQFIKPSLIIALTSEKGDRGSYEHGIFDIVLAQG
jgi:protocatechuate 3,4-dioxygenase beta subunit